MADMTNTTPAPAVPVLPPLPAPDTTWYASWSNDRVKFHSADQIYEFANARVKAALEAARLAGQGDASRETFAQYAKRKGYAKGTWNYIRAEDCWLAAISAKGQAS